jgi:hypothetical protein
MSRQLRFWAIYLASAAHIAADRSLTPEKLESLGRGVDLIVVLSTGKSGKFALEFTKPGGIAWQEHLPHEHADLPVSRIATIVCEGDRRNHRQWVQQ